MAVTQVSSAPSREEYEAVAKRLDMEGNPPAGLILHTASVLPSGEVQIIDVYDSQEALATFVEQRLFPVFAEAGVMDQVQASVPPQPHETFHLVRPTR